MENYRKKNALNNAKTARWHIQNAFEQLQPGDDMSLELAARFLIDAGQSLYKSAIAVNRLDESGDNSAVLDEIYNKYFGDIKTEKTIEL